MKKVFKIFASLFFVITLFCACSESETVDAGTFVERYAKLCDFPFGFSNIIASENGGAAKYSFVASKDENESKKILVTLLENENRKLFECRITMAKINGGQKTEFTADDRERFFSVCAKALRALSSFDEEKARNALIQLGIDNEDFFIKNVEQTFKTDEYFLVSIGNDVAAEVIISNTYLKKIEETEKPESKPVFGETTKIRTETVPHK